MKDNFLSSGVYGCVYHPPYDCQGNPIKNKKYVTKIVRSDFTTRTEYSIGKIIKEDGFITVVKKCDIESKQLNKSRMKPKCKLLEKDPKLEKKYLLLYSKYVKSIELADYLNNKSKQTIMKSYFLICNRINTLIEKGVIHHDLHFGNILYDGQKLYIIDFGLSLIQSKFQINNKPNYKYLKEAIFKYAPSWNFWTLEYHFLCYLIHDGLLNPIIIEHTIQYYLSHHKIMKRLGKDFLVKYKETATNYFMKYLNMSKDDIVIDLLKSSNTWDFYKNALHFMDIYNKVDLDLPSFMTLLLIMIHPIPEYRPTPIEVRQFNDVLIQSYTLDDKEDKNKIQFSKELVNSLKKTIISSKDIYEF